MAQKLKQLDAVTIATAGTRQQITASNIAASSVLISADAANTGVIYVGDVAVDSTNGIELNPGASVALDSNSLRGTQEALILSDIYVDTATNGNVARISYLALRK